MTERKTFLGWLAAVFITARVWMLVLPSAVYYSGFFMNQAVLVANSGKFPVLISDRQAKVWEFDNEGMKDNAHCRMTRETRLNWLADWVNLQKVVYSPGDILLSLGALMNQFAGVIWATLAIKDLV